MSIRTILAGLALGLGLATAGALPSIAAPATIAAGPLHQAAAGTSQIEQVQARRGYRNHRGFRYQRGRHGPRHRAYRRGYPYFYDGYYYRQPYLNSFRRYRPGVSFGITIGPRATPRRRGGSRHVAWCSNRYRTYDVRTDTFIARAGGPRVRCGSPYR